LQDDQTRAERHFPVRSRNEDSETSCAFVGGYYEELHEVLCLQGRRRQQHYQLEDPFQRLVVLRTMPREEALARQRQASMPGAPTFCASEDYKANGSTFGPAKKSAVVFFGPEAEGPSPVSSLPHLSPAPRPSLGPSPQPHLHHHTFYQPQPESSKSFSLGSSDEHRSPGRQADPTPPVGSSKHSSNATTSEPR
jgi:hypothetical protein